VNKTRRREARAHLLQRGEGRRQLEGSREHVQHVTRDRVAHVALLSAQLVHIDHEIGKGARGQRWQRAVWQ
jgi:hypothetical protein